MKAAVLVAPSKCEVRDLPLPEINDNEVLIKVKACGVCASELESWLKGSGGRNGVMGHEPVGTIEKMGRNVTGFSAGDRITGLIHGGFSEYTKADYRDCVKVPEKLDDFEALGEPLSCIVSGAER